MELTEGMQAPQWSLPVDGGATMTFAPGGKPLVLFLYPKDDTSGCTKEAVAFSEAQSDFEALGVRVVGLSPDPVTKHDKFKAKHGLTVPLVSDEDKTVLQAFGAWKEKSMYGKKYMGVERSTFLIGGDGRVVRAWRKVKVPGHVDEVLEAARALAG